MNDRIEQLSKIELFAGLKPQAIELIAKVATEENHALGTKIFQHGDAGDKLYLILEGKGFRPPLLTNAGFKYVLEIGRQDIPRRSSLFAWVKPKRPVPPQAIFEIGDRIGADGSEIEPLDEAAVMDAARCGHPHRRDRVFAQLHQSGA